MFGAVLVDQAANGATGGVVHTRDPAGANGHEFLLRLNAAHGGQHGGGSCNGADIEGQFLHGISSIKNFD